MFDILNKLIKSNEDNATGDVQLLCKLFSGERCSYHYSTEDTRLVSPNVAFSILGSTQLLNAAKLIAKIDHGHGLVDRILFATPQFFAKVGLNAADAVQGLREEHNIIARAFSSETGIDTTSMELFNLRTVSCEVVRRIVTSLPMNKSRGPDKISACVLKDCLPVILGPLTDIINCSILTSTFPDNWKEAEVIPILKDRDHEKAANNRPLSLLAVVSKVL